MDTVDSLFFSAEDITKLPDWAQLTARDPKISRALVSTQSNRSDLIQSVIGANRLIHCYGRPGFAIGIWLRKLLLAPTAAHLQPVLINEFSQPITQLREFLLETIDATTKAHDKAPLITFLLEWDQMSTSSFHEALDLLKSVHESVCVILVSSSSPDLSMKNLYRHFEVIHFGEQQLAYNQQDYERLTQRWPSKPTAEQIQYCITLFNGWPEACLRALCDIEKGDIETSDPAQNHTDNTNWTSGHQWIATQLFELPSEYLQFLLQIYELPVITPEAVDAVEQCFHRQSSTFHPEMPLKTPINEQSVDARRLWKSRMLTRLCNLLYIEQFTHPRLHFRWRSSAVRQVLRRLSNDSMAKLHTSLTVNEHEFIQRVTKLYLEDDYINEIIEISDQSQLTVGLEMLIAEQPGRVIDYFRGKGFQINTELQPETSMGLLDLRSNAHNLHPQMQPLIAYLQAKFFWDLDPAKIMYDQQQTIFDVDQITNQNLIPAADSIFSLITEFDLSRNALIDGKLAEGLARLEKCYLNAVSERCFTVAAPSIGLISLTDFFCFNKQHLKRLVQSVDQIESLFDPQSGMALVDWTDFCMTPIQLLTSLSQSVIQRLDRTADKFAGYIPEEAYLFQSIAYILAKIQQDAPQPALHLCETLKKRLNLHLKQLNSVIDSPLHEKLNLTQTSANLLIFPWYAACSFLELLAEIQLNGKPTVREARRLLKKYQSEFAAIQSGVDNQGLWHCLFTMINAFLQAIAAPQANTLKDLEAIVALAESYGYRTAWMYGSLFLSIAYWNFEEESTALDFFFAALNFADENELHEAFLALVEPLHPQIRRAYQNNVGVIMISKVYDRMEQKNHAKNNQLEKLSKRELEILGFINQGMSNEDIADHLCRAKGTIKLHVHNIYKKLEIRNRVEAIQLFTHYSSEAQEANGE